MARKLIERDAVTPEYRRRIEVGRGGLMLLAHTVVELAERVKAAEAQLASIGGYEQLVDRVEVAERERDEFSAGWDRAGEARIAATLATKQAEERARAAEAQRDELVRALERALPVMVQGQRAMTELVWTQRDITAVEAVRAAIAKARAE